MSFYHELSMYQREVARLQQLEITEARIRQAIDSGSYHPEDYWVLLSPEADDYLETMAWKARELTLQHFGKTVQLFTPLYLSNYCINRCIYCGYNAGHGITRRKLTFSEVEQEGRAIAATGLKHILILTGESPKHSPVDYIKRCVTILRPYFSSVSMEVYPLSVEDYRELIEAGIDGVTLFQEVYDEMVYGQLHLAGPKRDFRFRLEAPERVGKAGGRTIGIGALLGLHDWRVEAFLTGMHANYLQQNFPGAEVSVSLPRLCPEVGGFQPISPVSERQLVQILLALRIFLPRVGITISTRERQGFREHLIGLGVTKMSAGVSTAVGGHAVHSEDDPGQFQISDRRSVAEIYRVISELGYKPIFKDWHDVG
ncbi:MAG TPA: 2-iminoacetate synthase ThiH [Bacillota bacterium]|nr:2-iminoacetate synthase ThiH [Bacillota bacterium]